MNKKIILATFVVSAINTNVIAGFFDNLVDNLQNGDLSSLVTDVVTDVANEIDEAQDNSNIKGNTESNDVLNNLGTLFNNSNASDNSDSYSEDEAEHNIDSEEKEVDIVVVDYDQLSSPGQSFFGDSDYKMYYKGATFTGISEKINDSSKSAEYSEGYRVRTTYKDGMPNGLETSWFDDGIKRSESILESDEGDRKHIKTSISGVSKSWWSNGVLKEHLWRGYSSEAPLGFVERFWRKDGRIKRETTYNKDKSIIFVYGKSGIKIGEFISFYKGVSPSKTTVWNDDGIKTFEGLGKNTFYHTRGDDLEDTRGLWLSEEYLHEFPEGYALKRTDDGIIKSLHTKNTKYFSDEKCTYDYLMTDEKLNSKYKDVDKRLREIDEGPYYSLKKAIEYLDEKKKLKAINAQSGNYSIESINYINKCVPIAYKVCKEANGVDKCDALFYQGKYSREYLEMKSYKDSLVRMDKKNITDILSSNKSDKKSFYEENKFNQEKNSELGEKRLNIFKDMGIEKPNIYYGGDLNSTVVDGVQFWKDSLGAPVTGIIFGGRKSKLSSLGYFINAKDGLANGLKWTFYSNGMLSSVTGMKDGVLHGRSLEWDEYGYQIKKIKFKNGKVDGKSEIYYDRDTFALITNKNIPAYEMPTLVNEYDIFKDWKNVVKKYYSEKLPLKRIATRKNGKLIGTEIQYWPNGKKRKEYKVNEINGKYYGNSTYYYPWKVDENTGEQKVHSTHKLVNGKVLDDSKDQLKLSRVNYLSDKGSLGMLEAFMSESGISAQVNNGDKFGNKGLIRYKTKNNSKDRVKLVSDSLASKRFTTKQQAFVIKPSRISCDAGHGSIALKKNMEIESETDVEKAVEKCQVAREKYFDIRKQNKCFEAYKSRDVEISEIKNLCSKTWDEDRLSYSYSYDMTPLDRLFYECSKNPDMLCPDRLEDDFESVTKNYPDLSNWEVLGKEKSFLLK